MSAMRETMWRQPDDLRRVLGDPGPAELAAERIAGRRVLLSGTGTSWHAANHGAALLRLAGVEAWAVQADESVLHGPAADANDALVLLSHRGTKHYTSEALARARAAGAVTVQISSIGAPGADIETCEPERSAGLHVQPPVRGRARLPDREGAGRRARAPRGCAGRGRRRARRARRAPFLHPPASCSSRAAAVSPGSPPKGALKIRETAYVAAAGYSMEYLLHGPSVALGADDALVVLDGGGSASERLGIVARVAGGPRLPRPRFRRDALGEALSVFALTTIVQRIALDAAEGLGSDPDSFGRDLPGRAEVWSTVTL